MNILFKQNEEYVLSRLELCTQAQKDFFKRMYPKGLNESNINRALQQIEATIEKNNKAGGK